MGPFPTREIEDMRNALVLLLVVFVLVAFSAPASAQWEDPYWGGIARIRHDMVDTPNAMLAQGLCRNHRGTGDLVEQSWCYGCKYSLDGQFEGRNPWAIYHGQCRSFFGRRTYHVPVPVPPEPTAETEPPVPSQKTAPPDIEIVVNQTGCRARVNGTELAPGESVRVHTPSSKVSVQSTTCSPVYHNLQEGTVALVCASK